jgi:hypothetical protein
MTSTINSHDANEANDTKDEHDRNEGRGGKQLEVNDPPSFEDLISLQSGQSQASDSESQDSLMKDIKRGANNHKKGGPGKKRKPYQSKLKKSPAKPCASVIQVTKEEFQQH